jgi:hypothetical protein
LQRGARRREQRAKMNGLELIASEYAQQIGEEKPEQPVDDGQLALAAACYASPEQLYKLDGGDDDCVMADPWPWQRRHDRRQQIGERKLYGGTLPADPASCTVEERIDVLARAGALIARELDRLLEDAHAPTASAVISA